MDNPKELTGLDPGNYDYPLADVSHLSEKEKIAVLQYTRNELPYSASISGKGFYRLFRLDKKKAIFFILWKTKQYKLLLKIVKLYFWKKIKYM